MGSVRYDQEADCLYVLLKDEDEDVASTRPIDDLRLLDLDKNGGIIGVEFIDASAGVDLRAVPFAPTVEQLIRDSGHQFKIFA